MIRQFYGNIEFFLKEKTNVKISLLEGKNLPKRYNKS